MTTHKIIYGTDTGSIEAYDQCIVLLVPQDMELDELEAALDEDFDQFEAQRIVTWEDMVDAFLLAMYAEGLDHDTRARIVTTVRDAIDNND